jgi:hypothetical protein
MARRGWIYLREDNGRGYCFGKTEDPTRRDAEYSKENPFIKRLDAFEANDMDAAEQLLIELTSHLRLLENSKEWVRYVPEVLEIFEGVRRSHALMTYEQWEELQELKKRAGVAGCDTTCLQATAKPALKPCPRCGFVDRVTWQEEALLCQRCSRIFP